MAVKLMAPDGHKCDAWLGLDSWRENFTISREITSSHSPFSSFVFVPSSDHREREREREMVGLPFDCLANPLGAVRLTFEKAVAAGLDPATMDGGRDWGAMDVFRDFLFDQGGLSHVPILDPMNLCWIQPNSLVRFRGMVQDMLGNEFYVGTFKDGLVWRTNKFTDVSSYPMASPSEMRVWERRPLYCVPVPGQNSWVEKSSFCEAIINRPSSSSSQHGEKRLRGAENDDTDFNVSDHEVCDDASACTKKQREDGISCQSSQAIKEPAKNNLPGPNRMSDFDTNSVSCLVKIYDSPEADLKLNDVFEFIGIFTFDPELAVHRDDSDEFSNDLCEDALAHLPPSKVPRLHCLIHRKLGVQDFLCHIAIEPLPSLVSGVRETLLRHLTAVLGNDGLAAHCMLLHLLSKVHARVENFAVGKLSLNLTGFTNETVSIFGDQLNLAIQSILPFSQTMLLTVEYLNTATLGPRKDYKTNRLVTGALQLPQGTHLTIDETQLKAGALNSVGVANAQLLKNLLECQKVEYEFEYYKMEMATDVQLLVLSEGKSNIFPADLVLPFRPTIVASVLNATTEEFQAWRWYLGILRSLPHDIDPAIQKTIEDDMVSARQVNRKLGSEDFSRWLTMARLMSASFGETNLSLEHWQMVKELERLRQERLA